MLPTIRSNEHLYPVPSFDLGKCDIKNFLSELKGFHEQFADCFHRSESREHFFKGEKGVRSSFLTDSTYFQGSKRPELIGAFQGSVPPTAVHPLTL